MRENLEMTVMWEVNGEEKVREEERECIDMIK